VAAVSLLVVDNPRDWPLEIAGVTVISARAYLTGSAAYGDVRAAKVFNLCKSYRYQSLGYYVSLLAEARGHRPMPRVASIEDLKSRNLVRLLTEDLEGLIQRALAPIKSDMFELSVYFGRNVAARHAALSEQLFSRLQAPLLNAGFERRDGLWRLRSVKPISSADIPRQHQAFAVQAASEYFRGRRLRLRRRPRPRYELAILHDPANPEPPSNAGAMRKFEKAAAAAGMQAELITRADMGRLQAFDALFIRDTTFANHYTYRFSRQAAAEGLATIDSAESIIKCNNKVYLAELLDRHGIPTLKSMLVMRDNLRQVIPALGLPCVLKQPDSSFSVGVVKVGTEEELFATASELLAKSELIIAQEYLPTEFDWRIGILARRPLFVCKYFMAPGHWQIVKHGDDRRDYVEGPTLAVPVEEAPGKVVRVALKAANLVGDGFYGVDVKQEGKRCYVIEVNDNPNVDAGNEDGVLKNALYAEIMAEIVRRIEARRRSAPR
jgi:glutathione synthase/RimK-type ligase-like ATP-grasp enzyme